MSGIDKEDKADTADTPNKEENTTNETTGFIFIYEYEGVFYSKLNQIEKSDGNVVTIHPVYYTGYNNNMTSENIIWNESENKYVSDSKDGSWLDTINEYPDFIFSMDTSEVVYYEDEYYHCEGCLLEHLVGDVNIVEIKQE